MENNGKNKFLVTGANGQLGKEFFYYSKNHNYNFIFLNKTQLDITNYKNLKDFIFKNKITHIINCAAFTDVEKSEKNPKSAFSVNAQAVLNLSFISKEFDIVLIHFSTDYIFDGTRVSPYNEKDIPNPLNIYGKSKLKGEIYIQNICKKFFIIRTSWLFGNSNSNFIFKIINWTKNKQKISISYNEISCPTSTNTIVENVMKLIKTKKYGIYNLTNTCCSRYEWGSFILKNINWNGKIFREKKERFLLNAVRPNYSVLDNQKINSTLNIESISWKKTTLNYLKLYF